LFRSLRGPLLNRRKSFLHVAQLRAGYPQPDYQLFLRAVAFSLTASFLHNPNTADHQKHKRGSRQPHP
jgi:hypothetical protein